MKAVPMIFNTEMVQALADGRKTVTRRPVKLSLHSVKQGVTLKDIVKVCRSKEEHLFSAVLNDNFDHVGTFSVPCRTGDLIYVRETFATLGHNDYQEVSPRNRSDVHEVRFKASERDAIANCPDWEVRGYHWRPSIHMPRWASRITLKITSVRIEQLTALRKSRGSVIREGFDNWPQFKHVWESIYGQSHPNDYVWVIEFEVIHKNVDEVLREMD